MRVGVDADGVCYDFISAMRAYLKVAGVGDGIYCEPDRWNVWECWGMTHREWADQLRQGVADGVLFRHGAVHEDAKGVLEALRMEGHTIHIVTDRNVHTTAHSSTALWLDEAKIPYDTLTFAADKTVVNVDVFIEDSVANAQALEAAGVQVLLRIGRGTVVCVWARGSWLAVRVGRDRNVRTPLSFRRCRVHSSLRGAVVQRRREGPEARTDQPHPRFRAGRRGPGVFVRLPTSTTGTIGARLRLASRYDAAQRHMMAFWGGEDLDPESGEPHPAHVKFHMNTLTNYGHSPGVRRPPMTHPLVAEEIDRMRSACSAPMPWKLSDECKLGLGRPENPDLCFYCDKHVNH